MRRVGLMVSELNSGSAIGDDLLAMFKALGSDGVVPVIMTSTGEADFPLPVMHYRDAELLLDSPDDLLIYHFNGVDPAAMVLLRRLACRIVVRYHGLPPTHVISCWSSPLGRNCQLGWQALAQLADFAIDGFLPQSEVAAAELVRHGIDGTRIHVVPQMHCCDELVSLADDGATSKLLENRTFNVLAVGDLSPVNGFEMMMESFSKVHRWGSLDIHLHHVGFHDPRWQAYTNMVVEILNRNGAMHRFTFYGSVQGRALATLYRRCDLFWTSGPLETSYLPVMQAMAFGLPILARRRAVAMEVCGEAAIYAEGENDTAVQLHEILADNVARAALVAEGRKQYQARFKPGELRRRFLFAISEISEQGSQRISATSLDRSGDWFGLPRHAELLDAMLPISAPLPAYGLQGRDRRMDLIDEAFRIRAEAVAAYLGSDDFKEYACELNMPQAGRHLRPELRLVWWFNRSVQSRFDLQERESVTSFCNWFDREGAALYAPLGLSLQSIAA